MLTSEPSGRGINVSTTFPYNSSKTVKALYQMTNFGLVEIESICRQQNKFDGYAPPPPPPPTPPPKKKKKTFENIVGKEETPIMFSILWKTEITIISTVFFSSANAFSLAKSNFLLLVKEFKMTCLSYISHRHNYLWNLNPSQHHSFYYIVWLAI